MLPSILYLISIICVAGVPYCIEREEPAPSAMQKVSLAQCNRLAEQEMSDVLADAMLRNAANGDDAQESGRSHCEYRRDNKSYVHNVPGG
jgi:hypothetical protein